MSPNQIEELFRLVTNAVSGIQRLEENQTETNQRLNTLEQGQAETNQKISALEQGQAEFRQEFNDFRGETRENFKEVKYELRSVNRRVDILNRDVLKVKETHDEILERVENLEAA